MGSVSRSVSGGFKNLIIIKSELSQRNQISNEKIQRLARRDYPVNMIGLKTFGP